MGGAGLTKSKKAFDKKVINSKIKKVVERENFFRRIHQEATRLIYSILAHEPSKDILSTMLHDSSDNIDQDDCWKIIDEYFKDNSLCSHQINSYNSFIDSLPLIMEDFRIEMKPPENYMNADKKAQALKSNTTFTVTFDRPRKPLPP